MATTTPILTVGPIPVKAIGGNPFNDGPFTGIRSVIIQQGALIESIQSTIIVSIQTVYVDKNGQFVKSPQHGTGSGVFISGTDEITLDYPDEFLISVSGTATPYFPTQNLVVRTLIIRSNKHTYGPYGTAIAGAQSFSTSSTGSKIVGFVGRSGVALDAIGTLLVPKDLISIGPFGGGGENPFDDGTFPAITRLTIGYGDVSVSLQTVYVTPDGENRPSPVHGTKPGGTTEHVQLASDEYLISISGYYTDTEVFDQVVKSLTFLSNKSTYGPYGTEHGMPFSTSTTAGTGKIVGFHGTSGEYLNSIAAYFEPLP